MYKVVLIDDEPMIVDGLCKSNMWEKWNCKVVATAHNGLEGKRVIESVNPDIVFLDIGMLLKPSGMDEMEEAISIMCENLKRKGNTGEVENTVGSFIVKNALNYIEENYARKLTLREVAEKTYVSQWHLSKLMNRHTGQSFSDILNHVRMEHAKELLKNPALRIGQISEQVGFLDMAHFSRVFKKQEGVSANEYRNKILGM